MRDDPVSGESVVLIVTGESEQAADELEQAIEDVGGVVEKRLQFGALRTEINQERIDSLCDLAGIESVETENAVGVSGDAGEDLG